MLFEARLLLGCQQAARIGAEFFRAVTGRTVRLGRLRAGVSAPESGVVLGQGSQPVRAALTRPEMLYHLGVHPGIELVVKMHTEDFYIQTLHAEIPHVCSALVASNICASASRALAILEQIVPT